MPISNASKVLDLLESQSNVRHEKHRLRKLAVLGEKSPVERVAVMLDHNVQIFNEADSIDANEKYLVAMLEAMLEANIEDVSEIAEYAVEYLEAQNKTQSREYYPHMIVALINISLRRKAANNWTSGARISRTVGNMFKDMFTAGNLRGLRVSELMVGQLSQGLAEYVKIPRVAETLIQEVGDLRRVPVCLHEIGGDLTNRLFSTLPFDQRFEALRTAIAPKTTSVPTQVM